MNEIINAPILLTFKEVIEDNNEDSYICATFDGIWQKRGHSSLNGRVRATSLPNDIVIDTECLTKYCSLCKNKEIGVSKMFQRSEVLIGVRYIKY